MEFCWLAMEKVTFTLVSQQNSLRDPASATPRTFACSLRSTRESSTRASPFAQDDIWTDVCLLSDVLTRYSRICGIFGGGTPKICESNCSVRPQPNKSILLYFRTAHSPYIKNKAPNEKESCLATLFAFGASNCDFSLKV